MKKTKIINLLAGPGAGKSTLAAQLYFRMKNANLSCELVREYVKDWAWEGKQISKYDQLYILGKQSRRESLLYGKVDFIITDSPILLAGYYAEHYLGQSYITSAARSYISMALLDGHIHTNFVVKRCKDFNSEGRYETEQQAKAIDTGIESYLERYAEEYTLINEADSAKADAITAHYIPNHSLRPTS